jgi:hypothetical protein
MAFADSLRIGSIEYISPDKLEVLLDIEAPDAVALNTGSPRAFPRVNGYVLVPTEGGFAVGQVEWISVERSPYPQRKGMRDFGLVDMPYPMRKMSLTPVGILSAASSREQANRYSFRRGIQSFPTVGDPVLLPTTEQLKSIVESGDNRRVLIGTSPLAADAEVRIDPDRLFGRHLAVLGNTGSGKSCSVAGLIRWSLDAARLNRAAGALTGPPNARFIVLDPNGEYAQTFQDLGAKVFSVEPSDGAEQLEIPLWFWNTDEWSSFTQATPKTQRPTLVHALRALRDGRTGSVASGSGRMRRYLRTLVENVNMDIAAGTPWAGGGKSRGMKERVEKWRKGISDSDDFNTSEHQAVDALISALDDFLASYDGRDPSWPVYTRTAADQLLDAFRVAHEAFGGMPSEELPLDADVPRPFTGEELLRSVEANAELLGVSEHVETMIMRIRTLLGDPRLRTVFGEGGNSLENWLDSMMAKPNDNAEPLAVVDLSLVPAEALHIITSVIARMVLEALQRYRKLHDGAVLPTVLVMEEAHTFVQRYPADAETRSAQEICARAFEKIAREGRKFGLGLVLSSQRPSELSPTVLSQCNTFLLHRLSNHTDQDLVHRLVPDNMRGLLRDLPSLPSRNAILLGWASELPVAVEVRKLPREHQPRSNDPDFWHVWSGHNDHGEAVTREVDWTAIAEDWQQRSPSEPDLE